MPSTVYPRAVWRPIPEAATQSTIVPVMVIFHTIVGSAAGAIRIMEGDQTPGESHLVNPFVGPMTQLVPVDVRADCNWKVNAWVTPVDLQLADRVVPAGTVCGAVSIESEDDGTPEDTPWNPNQVEHFVDFSVWAHRELGIPIHRCPDPFRPGFGYHSMPGLNRLAVWEPNARPPYGQATISGRLVNVYNPWTNTVGKSCPGPARIAQFDGILAEARRRVAPPSVQRPPAPQPPILEEDDDVAVIITNSDPLPAGVIPNDTTGQPKGDAKFLLLDSGRLRHIPTFEEWAARGGKAGIPWTTEQIVKAGVVLS
jgi:hypothetical protein